MTAYGYKNNTNLIQPSSVQEDRQIWRTWYTGHNRELFLLWILIGEFERLSFKKTKPI